MDMPSIADQIIVKLEPYLGRRVFGRTPDTLTVADLPALLEGMRPMLRTLVGEQPAESVLQAIKREVKA